MTNRASLVALVMLANGIAGAHAFAESAPPTDEEFRVDNAVFVNDQKEPQLESTTIFYRGAAYDYLKKPAEIIILDPARDRFVLLDVTRRLHAEVDLTKVREFVDGLQRWAETQSDPLAQFMVHPKFDEAFEESSGELTLSSPWLTYRLTTIPSESTAIARQYRAFSDWYARLNTLLTPGSRPPFARLLVNAAVDGHQRFATQVHLSMKAKRGIPPKKVTVRSEHQLIRRLVESDRDRIAQTDQFLAIFQRVGFEEYLKSARQESARR